MDYYDIELKEAIGTLGTQTIANLCASGAAEFCGLIQRDADGIIQSVRNTVLNINELSTRGFDIEVAYSVPMSASFGELNFRLLATHVAELVTVDSTGAIDRAGMTGWPINATAGMPDWAYYGALFYQRGVLNIGLQARYIPEGKQDVTLIGPQDPGYDPFLPNSVNNNRVSSRFYTDLSVGYDVSRHELRTTELFLTIDNLFDLDPPVAPGTTGPTNQILFDPVGRNYRAGIRFAF